CHTCNQAGQEELPSLYRLASRLTSSSPRTHTCCCSLTEQQAPLMLDTRGRFGYTTANIRVPLCSAIGGCRDMATEPVLNASDWASSKEQIMAFRGLFVGIDRYASPAVDELRCAC